MVLCRLREAKDFYTMTVLYHKSPYHYIFYM